MWYLLPSCDNLEDVCTVCYEDTEDSPVCGAHPAVTHIQLFSIGVRFTESRFVDLGVNSQSFTKLR